MLLFIDEDGQCLSGSIFQSVLMTFALQKVYPGENFEWTVIAVHLHIFLSSRHPGIGETTTVLLPFSSGKSLPKWTNGIIGLHIDSIRGQLVNVNGCPSIPWPFENQRKGCSATIFFKKWAKLGSEKENPSFRDAISVLFLVCHLGDGTLKREPII